MICFKSLDSSSVGGTGAKHDTVNTDVYYKQESKYSDEASHLMCKTLQKQQHNCNNLKYDGCIKRTNSVTNDQILCNNWCVSWGSFCRQTATKENQDGWLVLRAGKYHCTTKKKKNLWGSWKGATRSECHIDHDIYKTCNQCDCNDSSFKRIQKVNNQFLEFHLDPWGKESLSSSKYHRNAIYENSKMNQCKQGDSSGSSSFVIQRTEYAMMNCLQPWIFGVFDGHGTGGRTASMIAAETFGITLEQTLGQLDSSRYQCFDNINETFPHVLEHVKTSLLHAFEVVQQKILDSNQLINRDFGTTAVVVACVGQYFITATCGDSSAMVIIGEPYDTLNKEHRVKINVLTSVDHSLRSLNEIKRLHDHTGGNVVVGDRGILRLIPSRLDYQTARMQGLSINMGRALGHSILSHCGLLPIPDITLIDIVDMIKALSDSIETHQRISESQSDCMLFEAQLFDNTIKQKFPNMLQTNHLHNERRTETLRVADNVMFVETFSNSNSLVTPMSKSNQNIQGNKINEMMNTVQSHTQQTDDLFLDHSLNDLSSKLEINAHEANNEDECNGIIILLDSESDTDSHNGINQELEIQQNLMIRDTTRLLRSNDLQEEVHNDTHRILSDSKKNNPNKKLLTPELRRHITTDPIQSVNYITHLNNAMTDKQRSIKHQERRCSLPRIRTPISRYGISNSTSVLTESMKGRQHHNATDRHLSHIQQTKDKQIGNIQKNILSSSVSIETDHKIHRVVKQDEDYVENGICPDDNDHVYKSHTTDILASMTPIPQDSTQKLMKEETNNQRCLKSNNIDKKTTNAASFVILPSQESSSPVNMITTHSVKDTSGMLHKYQQRKQFNTITKLENKQGQQYTETHMNAQKDTCQSNFIIYQTTEDNQTHLENKLCQLSNINLKGVNQQTSYDTHTEDKSHIKQFPFTVSCQTSFLEKSPMYLVLMSDGISDVMSRQEVGEFILRMDIEGHGPIHIANVLTCKAEQIRRNRELRADNCTALVVKLNVCMEE